MYNFSPSSLSLMKDCPRCFWLLFNKNIRRPDGIFSSLPNGMDRLFKEHFDRCATNGTLPKELNSLQGTRLYDNFDNLTIWRNPRQGLRFQDQEGTVLRGAIDTLLIEDEKLVVLDYKTRGFPLKDDTHAYYQDQMDLYTYLLHKNNLPTADHAYLLFYYPNTITSQGDIVFHNTLVRLAVSFPNAESILSRAKTLLAGPMPVSAETCGFCSWRETSVLN